MRANGVEGVAVHGEHAKRDAGDESYLSLPAADDGPFFYLSYAHGPRDFSAGRDPDLWVAQLYDNLCKHVKLLADLAPPRLGGFVTDLSTPPECVDD